MTITERPGQRQRVTRQALRAYFPDGRWGSRVQALPDYGCVFVKNAKAGTSTLLQWLHRIHTDDHGYVPQISIHGEHALPRPREVGWSRIVAMLGGDGYRFTFVRDPVRRTESAYRSKIVQAEGGHWRAMVRQVLRLDDDRTPTFDQFVAALESQEPVEMDAHWRPQHLNLMHPLVTYDHIGRLETFDRDLAVIRDAAKLPDVPVEIRNTTRYDGGVFDGRPGLLRRVKQVYARDFELYNY